MENCGGGQRLPPDGDEFPAAYQEFGNSNNQSYRHIAATRTTTAITANGGGLCNENELFRGSETFKMLANDSNVVGSRSVIISDSKITLTSAENVRQDAINKVALANIENVRPEMSKTASANIDNMSQGAKSLEIPNDERKSSYRAVEEIAKKNAHTAAGGLLYSCQMSNGNSPTSEKKMEIIAGYCHKDATMIEMLPSRAEKDTPVDTPPPLPLTGIYSKSS